MKNRLLLFTVLLATVTVFAADDKDAPPPIAPNGNEMPLELYQKIKTHFDALYGAQVGLLGGSDEDKKAADAALRSDAAANKNVLIKALKSSQTVQREVAARTMEYTGDKPAAIKALGETLLGDKEESVRRAAAAGLNRIPDAASVDALIKGLDDSGDSVRGLCATALGTIKDSRATEPLLKVLANESKPLVRMQAATALSKIKDPKALEELAKLMDAEKDERVKMAIAGAIRSSGGGDTAQTEAVPNAADAANELASLAKEMKEVEEKLRGDRHDVSVQNQGKDIEKKLATLIEKLDKQCNGGGQGQGQGQKQSQQQQQQQQQGKGSGSGGKQGSEIGSATPPTSAHAAQVANKTEAWAKLPAAQRDELLQAFREDVPERWRKRLEAYFLSIASEEAREAEKENK